MDSNNSDSKFFTFHFQLLHTVFPAATGVYAGGIGELFQSGHLVGRQHDPGGLGSLTPGPSGEGESKAPRFSGENLGG